MCLFFGGWGGGWREVLLNASEKELIQEKWNKKALNSGLQYKESRNRSEIRVGTIRILWKRASTDWEAGVCTVNGLKNKRKVYFYHIPWYNRVVTSNTQRDVKKRGPFSLYSLYDCSIQFIRKTEGTRETREGWPLLTVETELNGDSKSTKERGPSLVG
jgi:hypothetical protein